MKRKKNVRKIRCPHCLQRDCYFIRSYPRNPKLAEQLCEFAGAQRS